MGWLDVPTFQKATGSSRVAAVCVRTESNLGKPHDFVLVLGHQDHEWEGAELAIQDRTYLRPMLLDRAVGPERSPQGREGLLIGRCAEADLYSVHRMRLGCLADEVLGVVGATAAGVDR